MVNEVSLSLLRGMNVRVRRRRLLKFPDQRDQSHLRHPSCMSSRGNASERTADAARVKAPCVAMQRRAD